MVKLIRKEIKWISIFNTVSQAGAWILIYLVSLIWIIKVSAKMMAALKPITFNGINSELRKEYHTTLATLSIKYISLLKLREPWRFNSKEETIMSKMMLF